MISSHFFTALNIDEAAVMARFAGNSLIFEKFLRRFPSDPSWSELETAVSTNDYAAVETAAHTLKEVASNFGFSALSQACAEMVTAVRNGSTDRIPALFQNAKAEYDAIIKLILAL